MLGVGYGFGCVGLLFGLGFIAVNVRICLKFSGGRRPRELQSDPEVTVEVNEVNAFNTSLDAT